MKDRKWKFGGDPVDKSARLANLAAARKDADCSRIGTSWAESFGSSTTSAAVTNIPFAPTLGSNGDTMA